MKSFDKCAVCGGGLSGLATKIARLQNRLLPCSVECGRIFDNTENENQEPININSEWKEYEVEINVQLRRKRK